MAKTTINRQIVDQQEVNKIKKSYISKNMRKN